MFSLNHPNGKIFENKLTLTKTQQDNVVKGIVKNYDIDSIEFLELKKDIKTGTYHLIFIINDKIKTGLSVSRIDELNSNLNNIGLSPIENFKELKRGQPLDETEEILNFIKVKYIGE
ncbi:hypothetical protein SORDD24_01115 [Streptococcus oralis]|uniref:Uncharacterized protein n=2 Tax=Streptococcus oralis TaxID=1303 RepID=A0A139QQS4_STROR|nr:hypothetical protein SORDD24_01115 [Streptococcus oralis]